MEHSVIQSIHYNPQEYLEVVLSNPLDLICHVYYLSNPYLLNGFVHLSSPNFIYFDTKNLVSLKHYVSHHAISKADLKTWCLFLMDQFELESDGYFLIELAYVFIDENSKQLMLCKIPQTSTTDYSSFFQTMLLEMYECMNYEDDEEWISQMYLLLKQRPFKLSLFRQFLMSKKNKRWLSFFKKEEDDLDQFFKMMQVKESEPVYGMTTVPFETQVLMAGFQYGYLTDENHRQILIKSSPYLMGRQKDCHYVLDFPDVSKNHCRLLVEEGKCYVEDLGSTNGTYVNEHRISSKTPLKEKDVLKLAGHCLIYHE